jgi:hypothetical protein
MCRSDIERFLLDDRKSINEKKQMLQKEIDCHVDGNYDGIMCLCLDFENEQIRSILQELNFLNPNDYIQYIKT